MAAGLKPPPVYNPTASFGITRPVLPRPGGQQPLPGVNGPVGARPTFRTTPLRTGIPTLGQTGGQLGGLMGGVQFQTPQQLAALQQQMVNAQIGAQTQAVQSYADYQRKQALLGMQAQSDAGRAAAAMNANLFGQVGGAYNNAAQNLAGMTTAGVGQTQAINQADVDRMNAALASVGQAPVDVTGKLAGQSQAAVEQFRAGLGAANLAQQGEAAQFGLAGLTSAQNLRATQEAQAAYNQSTRDINAQTMQQLGQINAQRPALALQTQQSLQDANRQQIALAASLIGQQAALGQQLWQRGFAKQQLGVQARRYQQQQNQWLLNQTRMIKEFNSRQSLAQYKIGLPDNALSRTKGYLVDHTGKAITNADGSLALLPGWSLDPKTGKPMPPAKGAGKATSAAGGALPTPSQISSYLKSIAGQPQYQSQTSGSTTGGGTSTTSRTQTGTRYPVSFQQALKRLTTWGGLDDTKARQYLQSVYPRGAGGRAWLTNEEQQALQKTVGWDYGKLGVGQIPQGWPGPVKSAQARIAPGMKDQQGNPVAYLSAQQMWALQQAGVAPTTHPGLLNGQQVYYINPGS